MKVILHSLFSGRSLERAEARRSMDLAMSGELAPEQVAAFLGALRAKKETVEELVGFALSMRAHGVPVPCKRTDLMDSCGTGGDGSGTFNISTAAALVLAGAGVGVAKHGNRSVSSRCGSADVLEALGVKCDLSPERVAQSIDSLGFGFLFAPQFHPLLKNLAGVRRALGVPTVLNLLGPVVNPAKVKRQVVGIYDPSLLENYARLLLELGSEEVMVVCAENGLDEISLSGATRIAHLKEGKIKMLSIKPEDAGLPEASLESLRGGDARENAATIEAILKGVKGPKRDVVLINAAAGFWVAGRCTTFREGVQRAAQAIDSGAAFGLLAQLRSFS